MMLNVTFFGRKVSFGFTICIIISIVLPLHINAQDQSRAKATPPHEWPNLRVGLGNDVQGDTIPGPALPRGSIHPSPQTLKPSNAGYHPDEPISGFAQLHTQGSGGTTSYGTFLLSPQVGKLEVEEALHLSPKSHEIMRPDYYAVELSRYQTKVEVSPSQHAAIYRISYPTTNQAQILLDVTRKIGGVVASEQASVQFYPHEGKMSGFVRTKGYWQPSPITIWFVAKFDQNPLEYGIYHKGMLIENAMSASSSRDEQLCAWWRFDAKSDRPLHVKIAVSLTSLEKAEELLGRDISDFDFDRVRTSAQAAWDKSLGAIEVSGMDDAARTRFYSSLYHSFIQPRDRSLDVAAWETGKANFDDHYTLWDTYRTLFPLMSLIDQEAYQGSIKGFHTTFERWGAVDTAVIGGRNYYVGQGGDEVDNVIGEAYLRGASAIDWGQMWRVVRHNATEKRRSRYLISGYFAVGDDGPEGHQWTRAKSGSSTLGYAINDYYAAQLARGVGDTKAAEKFAKRAQNWRNVWDEDTQSDGFSGFIIPKYADGRFQKIDAKAGWDGKKHSNVGFYEGSSWIYSFGILHDIDGMIEAMGGRVRFYERLEHAMNNGLIDLTNEPSFSTPYLFHAVGRPERSRFWAAKVNEAFTSIAYPGDEDAGAMSSNHVFNTIGLFPKLGSDLYYVHGPMHARSVLTVGEGKKFIISAPNVSKLRPHIARARLNGQDLTTPYLSQKQILSGGELILEMSDRAGEWVFDGAVMPFVARDMQKGAVSVLNDGKTRTIWLGKIGDKIAISLRKSACLKAYSLTAGQNPDKMPHAWRLWGKNKQGQWRLIDEQTGQDFAKSDMTRTFALKAHTYRALQLEVFGTKKDGAEIGELELIAAAQNTCPPL